MEDRSEVEDVVAGLMLGACDFQTSCLLHGGGIRPGWKSDRADKARTVDVSSSSCRLGNRSRAPLLGSKAPPRAVLCISWRLVMWPSCGCDVEDGSRVRM